MIIPVSICTKMKRSGIQKPGGEGIHGKCREKSLYWFADLLDVQSKRLGITLDQMSGRMSRLNLLLVAAVLVASAASGADWGKERPIAIVAGSEQEQPAIDGHIIAWADNRSGNYDIFMYDLETGLERWACVNPFLQVHPAVSGERIVWQDMRSGKADIYMYDTIS